MDGELKVVVNLVRSRAVVDLRRLVLEIKGFRTLCDDWFWLERLTYWNWGYGG